MESGLLTGLLVLTLAITVLAFMKIANLQKEVKSLEAERKEAKITKNTLLDDYTNQSARLSEAEKRNSILAQGLHAAQEERDKLQKDLHTYQTNPLDYLCIRGGELQALRLSAKESEGLKYKAFLFGKTEDISGDICLKPIL